MHYVVSVGAALITAALTGCGAPQPPLGATDAVPQAHAAAANVERSPSWMLPEAKDENLLYVADRAAGGVIVYTYRPKEYKYVGFLSGPSSPDGECVDKAQHVFVTNYYSIFEYAHGGSEPIAILDDPAGETINCSVDPTTGNLAVVDAPLKSGGPGLALFRRARGKPTLYTHSGVGNACSYDDKGNLFIDSGIGSNFQFLELPKGSSTFTNITLNQTFSWAGGVQWDGKHIAVGDFLQAVIYAFDIVGSNGKEVGSTPLDGSTDVRQFFIAGTRVIASSDPQSEGGYIKVYDYPAGGQANRTLNFGIPTGVVVSLRSARK